MAFAYRSKGSTFLDSSDTDESDKECLNWKRATQTEEIQEKVSMVVPPEEPSPQPMENSTSKRKQNTIWCEVLQDQMMSETLNHCGIKNKPKNYGDRGEESYDYRLGKRKYHDSGSDEEMSGDSERTESSRRPAKRFKNNLFVELDSEGVKTAKKIIRVLNEQKKYLIYRVVKHLGIEQAMKFLKMTEDIEENGGLMIKNNERRRTPGGVYFHLLRSDLNIDQNAILKIFEGEMNSYEHKQKINELRKQKRKMNRSKYRQRKKMKGKMDFESLISEDKSLSPTEETLNSDPVMGASSVSDTTKESFNSDLNRESTSPDSKNESLNSINELHNSDIKLPSPDSVKESSNNLLTLNSDLEQMEEDNNVCPDTVNVSDLEEGEIE